MQCNFYVGQRVVCVNADPKAVSTSNGTMDGLREGATYTVREIRNPPKQWLEVYPLPDDPWVYLQEINRASHLGGEVGYVYWRFRPATDISSLEALLHTTKTPELV